MHLGTFLLYVSFCVVPLFYLRCDTYEPQIFNLKQSGKEHVLRLRLANKYLVQSKDLSKKIPCDVGDSGIE
jgi:hypothetical protein